MAAEILDLLHQRLSIVLTQNDEWQSALTTLVERPLQISPWESWLLLALVRHHSRQQFVLACVESRLGGDASTLASHGAFGQPGRPSAGLLPGDTQWRYRFHGRGCCLTSRDSGEEIDVDFFDDTADWFTSFCFIKYLESLKKPRFVEQRLSELYPNHRAVVIGIEDLQKLGIIELGEYSEFRLSGTVQPLCDLLFEIERHWKRPGVQALFAAALCDWHLLSRFDEKYRDLSQAGMDAKYEQLATMYFRGKNSAAALELLADLGAPQLSSCIQHALRGPSCAALSAALNIVAKQDDAPERQAELEDILARIDPNGELPSPYIWLQAAKLLSPLARTRAFASGLQSIQSSSLGGAALLAMQLNLPNAMDLIRRSLRSSIPVNRIEIAAALAIIDLPWCRRELAMVLSETDDQASTTECRSALRESRDATAHQIVADWERRHPHVPSNDPVTTFGELAKLQDDRIIQYEMRTLHSDVIGLRNAFVPTE